MTTSTRSYDPFAADFYDDPFPVYRWMRDEAPVYYSQRWGWWALSRFADVRAAALDADTFRSFEGIDIDDTAKDQSGPGFLPDLDNPRHDQVRELVQGHFLPRRIAAQEDSIRTVVRGLIASWADRDEVDLATELAWLEVTVAAQEALPVLGDYALAGPPVRYRSTPNMYVWSRLPLRRTRSLATPAAHTAVHRVAGGGEPVADVRVEAKQQVAEGVVALTLREAGGRPLPGWAPGAHVDLLLDGGPTRQYSLCGDPADRTAYRLGVLRDPAGRGGSLHVHDRLSAGDVVQVRGPRNHFPLVDAPRYLFVAGGIGITPILTMIAAAERAGRPWQLVYGGRQRASMAFLDELATYGDRVSVRPQDETGLLDLDALLGEPRAGTAVYCCGPEPLLAAVEQRCAAWPPGALHVERFGPRPHRADERNEAFEVVLARSGLTLQVPADRSILSRVDEAGVGVLSSCSEGTCGTCETRVLEGLPDHRDAVLTPDERQAGDCLMICVSRSRSDRLVLDL